MSTHELEKKELEENFEKLRLSLQVNIHSLNSDNQDNGSIIMPVCRRLSSTYCVLDPALSIGI